MSDALNHIGEEMSQIEHTSQDIAQFNEDIRRLDRQLFLKNLAELCNLAVEHYKIVNGERRGKPELAAEREVKAINVILKSLNCGPMNQMETDAFWM